MSNVAQYSPAKERVLDVAERLFMQNGYRGVTLRDVADALGIRQASLYYHFPNGKEELFVAMAVRVFQRHRAGIEAAVERVAVDLASQLMAVANWLESQPPVNFLAMVHSDVSALDPDHARQVSTAAYEAVFTPLRHIFDGAQARGETRPIQSDIMSGFFMALMDGITVSVNQQQRFKRRELAQEAVRLIMQGVARDETRYGDMDAGATAEHAKHRAGRQS